MLERTEGRSEGGPGESRNVMLPTLARGEQKDFLVSPTSSQLLEPRFLLNSFSRDNQRPFTFVINSSCFECHVVLVLN